MNVSMEIKKAEALKRMKALGIFNETIKQFEKEDLVSCSEPPMGANFWLYDEQKAMVDAFEKENNALVYFVIRSYTQFGKLDTLLFVSDYQDEWEMDNDAIKDGFPFAYVYNYDIPEFSEFGSVGVEQRFGGLIRIA